MTDDTHSGGCQCGAIRYRVTGELSDSGVCHCRMCQKASGSFGMILVSVPIDKLEWTRGTPSEFASTPATMRGFCDKCGTPLYLLEEALGAYDLCVGTLDDPTAAPPDHAVGTESQWPCFDQLASLPSKTTAEDRTPEELARFTSNQHPDHDTENWPED